MQYFLAVDGGGSKTHVLCADETGTIVGEAVSGPSNFTATDQQLALRNLLEAITAATQELPPGWQIKKMVVGLAGVDTPTEEKAAEEEVRMAVKHLPVTEMVLVNDVVTAMLAGTDKPNAVAIIAGTGSNCYGRNEAGQLAKTGGLDFLLSDEGSGYAIGRAVLQAAVKSYDGRAPKTLLEQLICEHFRIPTLSHIKEAVYHPVLTKSQIAELAAECEKAQQQGDSTAKQIFDEAVRELCIMVSTVIEKLGMKEKDIDCVLVGGVTKIAYVQAALESELHHYSPLIQLVFPEKPPVYGALKMAMRQQD